MRSHTDYLHITVVLYLLDCSAILANTILIYAIATKTPNFMRKYSIFLLNNAFVDILSAVVSALGTIRIVNTHIGQIIFVSLGPCSYVGHWFCHLSHCVHLTFASQSIVILLLSYCYRLLVISQVVPRFMATKTRIWSVCLVSFLPSVAAVYSFYLRGEIPPDEIMTQYGIYGYLATCPFSGLNLRDVHAFAPLTYFVLCAPVAMVLIFLVRRQLIAQIDKADPSIRSHHKRIAQALTYQMLLPSGLALGATIWLVDLMEISYGELSQRSEMVVVSLFAVASPLINLFFLPPYRRIIRNTIQRRDIEKAGIKCDIVVFTISKA